MWGARSRLVSTSGRLVFRRREKGAAAPLRGGALRRRCQVGPPAASLPGVPDGQAARAAQWSAEGLSPVAFSRRRVGSRDAGV
jgi:hypothetical protein